MTSTIDFSRKRPLEELAQHDAAPPAKRVTDENAEVSVEDDGIPSEGATNRIAAAFRTIIEVLL